MIDWNGKLEAVHTDGRVEPVTLLIPTPDRDGDYRTVETMHDGLLATEYWTNEGKPSPAVSAEPMKWTIRNASPTPDGRAVALAKRFAQDDVPVDEYLALKAEARAIVAALEPVDADVEIARDLSASLIEKHSPVMAENIRAGDGDHYSPFVHVLAAIKRGRQLEKEGK